MPHYYTSVHNDAAVEEYYYSYKLSCYFITIIMSHNHAIVYNAL